MIRIDDCIVQSGIIQILTHGLELTNQLLLGPLGPLFLVCIDGAQDGTTWFPTILYGWDIQIVDEHNIRVLWGTQRERGREGERERGRGRLDEMTRRIEHGFLEDTTARSGGDT